MGVAVYILLTIAFLSFSASVVFSYLNNIPDIVPQLFWNSTADVELKYWEYATPEGIVFTVMWPVIYISNAIGLLYMLLGAFIPPRMSPVKVSPSLTPPLFLATYSLAFLMTVGWLFAYSAEILQLSLGFLVLAAVFSFVAIGSSCKTIHDNIFTLEIKGNVMMWMIRVLVQNPLCIFATWMVIAAVLNMTDVILYYNSLHQNSPSERGLVGSLQDGSLIGLGVLFALMIIWFVIENFVWEKYCRYNFTIYPVFIFTLAGVIVKLLNQHHTDLDTRILIMASVVLAFSVMAFLIRIALFIYKLKARANASA